MNPDKLNPEPIQAFRTIYPKGENFVVSPVVKQPYRMRRGEMVFTVCSTREIP